MTNPLIQAYRKPALYVSLPSGGKYYKEKPVIFKNIIFNSKHFFISYLLLCKLQKNYELILLSTSKGIITHKEAIFYKLGGFIICKIS